MKQRRRTYNILQLVSAIFMVLSLVWLTVSAPFVYQHFQELQKVKKTANLPGSGDGECNPFSNTTEEKTENNTNSLSEYLHDIQLVEAYFVAEKEDNKCHSSDLYYAFHPELISPPPDVPAVI